MEIDWCSVNVDIVVTHKIDIEKWDKSETVV